MLKNLRKSHVSMLLIALVWALAGGCSDDTNLDHAPGVSGGGTDTSSADDATDAPRGDVADAGDASTTVTDSGADARELCGDTSCELNEVCVQDQCQPIESCSADQDLGTVFIDDTPVSHTLPEGSSESGVSATCSTASSAASILQFTAGESARVNLDVSSQDAVDWVVEVRQNNCDTSEETLLFCSDNEQNQFFVEEGVTYYVFVQPRQGDVTGAATIDMTWSAAACSPPGGRQCSESEPDKLELCYATGWNKLDCADGCTDDACHGDTCSNAIELTQSGLFEGEIEAYESMFDFAGRDNCAASGADTGTSTPGPDVIFALTNLTVGQVVSVDASEDQGDFNDNALFILADCSTQATCLEVTDLGDKLEWEVPADGTYYLVIDKTSLRSRTFAYHVDIQ